MVKKSKKFLSPLTVILFVCCILLFLRLYTSGGVIFEKNILPPDVLPDFVIDNIQLNDNNLVLKMTIEAKGKTPVLIRPKRLSLHCSLRNSNEKGNKQKIIEGESFVLTPSNNFSKEIAISNIMWFDEKGWEDLSIHELKKGKYTLQVMYNGTKEGLLKQDYDFKNSVSSNVIQFEIN